MNKDKIAVEIFFPFGACACSYATLMEKVGNVTTKYKDKVDVKMNSTKSKEAKEYAVITSCVIVDHQIRLNPDFEEKQLEIAITTRINKTFDTK